MTPELPPTTTRISTLRRVLVFVLLGPPLGILSVLAALPILLSGVTDGPVYNMEHFGGAIIVFILVSYFLGSIPALLAAAVDGLLERAGISNLRRVLVMAIGGGVLSLIPVRYAIAGGFLPPLGIAILSISGIVAGSVCSAITSRVWRRNGV